MSAHDRPAPVEAVVEELLQVTGQLLRRLRAEAGAHELTLSKAAVLKQLDARGAATTAELARAQAVKPQSMGVTLAGLERDGLVERRPHPHDRRQVLFSLSKAGTAMRRRHRLLKREWLVAAMAALDADDRRTLTAALGVIRRLGES